VIVRVNGRPVWQTDDRPGGAGSAVFSLFDSQGRQIVNVRLPVELRESVELLFSQALTEAVIHQGDGRRRMRFDED